MLENRRTVLVVADDLTGANATGAGFSRAGLRAVTIGTSQPANAVRTFSGRFEVVVINTDSRHATGKVSAARVTAAVQAGWPVEFVSKRIDTTLRGNIGVETAAALRAVARLSGRHVVGLCLPAHPAAGRCTVDGRQLLYGSRLEETELARDPRNPVRTSAVADVLTAGASVDVTGIRLSVVTGERECLTAALREAVNGGADIVVGDALTEDHLDRVASAAAELATADPRLLWVGIDPGPGTLALTRALGLHGKSQGGPLLAISGSATDLTRVQLTRLIERQHVRVVPLTSGPSGRPWPDVDATAAALSSAVAAAHTDEVVLLATVLADGDLLELAADDGDALSNALGHITRRVLDEQLVSGMFTTGGDATMAVLDQVEAHGLEVEDEVVPLAVSGWVTGGPWSGMPIVTKGGLVGDDQTTLVCIDHLARLAQQRRRRPRPLTTQPHRGPQ